MKISIITISFNSERTIRRTIESVLAQKNVELEYILIDGKSTDGTVDIIKEYACDSSIIRWVSEIDNGIYDAMNKGISMATGDIIGILNSDDMYTNSYVLANVVSVFKQNKDLESCYGNLMYIKTTITSIKPYRYWKSGEPRSFKYGWMPPHPAFFVKKDIYQKYGVFRLDCGTAADYELLLRFLERNHISTMWVDKTFVYMEAGGASGAGISAYKKSTRSDTYAWKVNNITPSIFFTFYKKLRKIPQFVLAKKITLQDNLFNNRP